MPGNVPLKGKRDYAMLATVLYRALRCQELCKLKVKDLRQERPPSCPSQGCRERREKSLKDRAIRRFGLKLPLNQPKFDGLGRFKPLPYECISLKTFFVHFGLRKIPPNS